MTRECEKAAPVESSNSMEPGTTRDAEVAAGAAAGAGDCTTAVPAEPEGDGAAVLALTAGCRRATVRERCSRDTNDSADSPPLEWPNRAPRARAEEEGDSTLGLGLPLWPAPAPPWPTEPADCEVSSTGEEDGGGDERGDNDTDAD